MDVAEDVEGTQRTLLLIPPPSEPVPKLAPAEEGGEGQKRRRSEGKGDDAGTGTGTGTGTDWAGWGGWGGRGAGCGDCDGGCDGGCRSQQGQQAEGRGGGGGGGGGGCHFCRRPRGKGGLGWAGFLLVLGRLYCIIWDGRPSLGCLLPFAALCCCGLVGCGCGSGGCRRSKGVGRHGGQKVGAVRDPGMGRGGGKKVRQGYILLALLGWLCKFTKKEYVYNVRVVLAYTCTTKINGPQYGPGQCILDYESSHHYKHTLST